MKTMERDLPLSCLLANIALLDVVEGLGHCSVSKDTEGSYLFSMEIYGNRSGFAAHTRSTGDGSVLTLTLTDPGPGLSDAGQLRALRYVIDSVEQLSENEDYRLGNEKQI